MSLQTKIKNQLTRTRDEFRLHSSAFTAAVSGDRRPRVLFFPSGRAEGASLLRAYDLANALQRKGWLAKAVPAGLKLAGRARVVSAFRPHLLVFQQCRHVLNSPDYSFGKPFVLDTDDADFYLEIPGLAERLEKTSRAAAGVMAGGRFLRDWHAERNPRTEIIWTGTPITEGQRAGHWERQDDGPPILAWAQAKPLDYGEELIFVQQLSHRLHARDVRFRLRLYGVSGDDEAVKLRSLFGPQIDLDLLPPLPYDDFLQSLRQVSVGLSPIAQTTPFSRGKSFGKILGYLDAHVPVIASDAADHALFFSEDTGVVSNDVAVWEDAAARLLTDPDARSAMANSAFARFQDELSIDAAAAKTDRFLRSLLK